MSLSLGLVLAVALSLPPISQGPVSELCHNQLRAGQRFEIATSDRIVRGEFVDPKTGECVVATSTTGHSFGPSQRVWLLGSTQGDQVGAGGLQLVLMHQVRVGMKIELGLGDLSRENRVLTKPVRSITLLGGPVASVQQTALR